jgi:hypothetical protein
VLAPASARQRSTGSAVGFVFLQTLCLVELADHKKKKKTAVHINLWRETIVMDPSIHVRGWSDRIGPKYCPLISLITPISRPITNGVHTLFHRVYGDLLNNADLVLKKNADLLNISRFTHDAHMDVFCFKYSPQVSIKVIYTCVN